MKRFAILVSFYLAAVSCAPSADSTCKRNQEKVTALGTCLGPIKGLDVKSLNGLQKKINADCYGKYLGIDLSVADRTESEAESIALIFDYSSEDVKQKAIQVLKECIKEHVRNDNGVIKNCWFLQLSESVCIFDE